MLNQGPLLIYFKVFARFMSGFQSIPVFIGIFKNQNFSCNFLFNTYDPFISF
jgi:hypothetical protein